MHFYSYHEDVQINSTNQEQFRLSGGRVGVWGRDTSRYIRVEDFKVFGHELEINSEVNVPLD